jgi:hypothetical protein
MSRNTSSRCRSMPSCSPIRYWSEQCRRYVNRDEQVAEIGPQLAKAREIAEKAEAENRALTP